MVNNGTLKIIFFFNRKFGLYSNKYYLKYGNKKYCILMKKLDLKGQIYSLLRIFLIMNLQIFLDKNNTIDLEKYFLF